MSATRVGDRNAMTITPLPFWGRRMGQVIALLGWVGICFLTAGIGARYSPGDWYVQLQKPLWTPPGYLFGPVWSILYLSMGVAAWLVWRRAGSAQVGVALTLFVVQLVLNGLWSWIFFGMQRPDLAFVEILILWAVILATMVALWRVSSAAGALFIPYAAWVSFAAVLNYFIWQLNTAG